MGRKRGTDVRKASVYAIVINSFQIVLVLVILCLILFGSQTLLGKKSAKVIAALSALIVIWGAAVDIREAFNARRMNNEMNQMDTLMDGMETLNRTLRSQRHDFKNHLQVVYSLIEMKEYDEANAYIEKVYGAITSVSELLKTDSPAINALLQMKASACADNGIRLTAEIRSGWKNLPVEGWEACKVLGNLIDNAADAIRAAGTPDPWIRVTLTEDIHGFGFSVANNGPKIPESIMPGIFRAGVTEKGEGHGMGLFIVSSVIAEAGGEIHVTSDEHETVFAGSFPKGNIAV